jgi:hypothetical protein
MASSYHRQPQWSTQLEQQQPQQQMFRVRDTSQRVAPQTSTGVRSPNGLNDSKFPVTDLLAHGGLEAQSLSGTGAAYRAQQGGRRDGAKPFLDELFDDIKQPTGGEVDDHRAGSAFDGRVPTQSYHEQVRRQWAKPNILQTCVSTDAVPLPTVTGPVNYTTFDTSHVERPEDPPSFGVPPRRGRVFSGLQGAVEIRKTRDALIVMPNGTIRPAMEQSGVLSGAAASSSFYNESEELSDVHLKFLLSTIDHVKRRTNPSSAFLLR